MLKVYDNSRQSFVASSSICFSVGAFRELDQALKCFGNLQTQAALRMTRRFINDDDDIKLYICACLMFKMRAQNLSCEGVKQIVPSMKLPVCLEQNNKQ
ncbi:CLUMA_CG019337, isoform A [Clunio marinus]|uniref:CLUMA_CG019337, isoform A n=1 Tax=Clunio marinus TaxID=568069 RepID=A0A1J1J0Q0_9DIPT|nr:CLUMA_CG019337, isoform A [Clunio marinus]